MYTEDLGGNDSGNGQTVEHVNEGLPRLDIAPSLAFVVEAVH